MPVEQPCSLYTDWQNTWMKCRDAFEGEDEVKERGPIYLPILSGMLQEEYDAYKKRATFYAATERTVKGLVGAIMRKDPHQVFPEDNEDILDSIGADDEPITLIAKAALEEILTVGRVGLYLDAPDEGSDNPYICIYYAENIVNWRTERIDGKNVLTLVVLKEEYEEISDSDNFLTTSRTRYRVLQLDKSNDSSVFTVQIWEENLNRGQGDNNPGYILKSTITPAMKGGRTLNYVPFVFMNASGVSAEIEKPPLLDLVNLNYSHYRSSADLEHGLHFTALPTAWVAGFDVKGTVLRIGSGTAWVSADPSANAGFLEFSGAGLGAISTALESKEQKMAILGARLLEDQKNAAEAATTVALRHAGERSVLSNISISCSEGLTQALQWTADWMGLNDSDLGNEEDTGISYVLNQDFNDLPLDAPTFQAMMLALQGGNISWDVWFNYLQKHDVYPDNWDENTEREKIAMGGPTSPPNPAGKPNTIAPTQNKAGGFSHAPPPKIVPQGVGTANNTSTTSDDDS